MPAEAVADAVHRDDVARPLRIDLDFLPQLEHVRVDRARRREFVGPPDVGEELLAAESLAGIFVGPGDLSTSLGKPAAFGDPEVIGAVAEIIRKARAAGKHAGILAAPGPLLDAALEAGADLVFVGNDIADLATSWKRLIEAL